MAVKVVLKDVVDKPMTKETNDFLSSLVGGEVEMKLVGTRQQNLSTAANVSAVVASKCCIIVCNFFIFC
jgi:hypothetical protein